MCTTLSHHVHFPYRVTQKKFHFHFPSLKKIDFNSYSFSSLESACVWDADMQHHLNSVKTPNLMLIWRIHEENFCARAYQKSHYHVQCVCTAKYEFLLCFRVVDILNSHLHSMWEQRRMPFVCFTPFKFDLGKRITTYTKWER